MSTTTSIIHLSTIFSVLALSACGAAPEVEEETESTEQPITGGALLGTAQEPFSVKLEFVGFHGCSGTKIGARRFLTANHCVWTIPVGATVRITTEGDGIFRPGDDYTITAVHRYPTNPANLPTGHYTDVGMFDVSRDSPNIEAYPNLFRAGYVNTGLGGGWFNAYGCDAIGNNDGQKQFGFFKTTSFGDPPSFAGYIHAEGESSLTQICPGDSGGALFFQRSDGAWEIAGIGSAPDSDGKSSFFTRIGRVHRWIPSPTLNVFTNGSRGSLLNFKGNNCIKAISLQRTVLTYCDLRNIPTDTQYWKLERVSGDKFLIRNTSTGTCLASANTILQHETCSPSTLRFQWRFVAPVGANGFNYFHIKNENEVNGCIGTVGDSVANNVALRTVGCSSGSLDSQAYAFIP